MKQNRLFTLFLIGILCLLGSGSAWADVTFTSGTVITFDATAYGSGMNIYLPGTASPAGSGDWWSSTSSKITFTLTSDWTVSTTTKLFQSAATNWSAAYATTLPTDNTYTVLTTTDGKTYSWSQPSTEASLSLTVSSSSVVVGSAITLTATANNFATVPTSYKFTYTKDDGDETAVSGTPTISDNTATITFTPTETGSYSFKVVTDTYSDTKTVTVSNYTWQIHGSMTSSSWASTDFTEVAGTKTATCTFESLTAGTYGFGIKRNLNNAQNAWFAYSESKTITESTTDPLTLTSSNTSDLYITVAEDGGPYVFTLDYTNVDAPTLSVTYPLTVKIAGDFTETEWSPITLESSEDKTTCSTTYSFTTTGSKSFKLIFDNTWKDAVDKSGNALTITRANNTTESENGYWKSGDTNNNKLTVDIPGTYTFTYNYSTQILTVTYPNAYTRTVTGGNLGSICIPFGVNVADCEDIDKVFEVTTIDKGTVTLTSVKTMTAGVPYIFRSAKTDGDTKTTIIMYSNKTAASEPVNDTSNALVGNFAVADIPQSSSENGDIYILQSNQFKYVNSSTLKSGANRCYLKAGSYTGNTEEARADVLGIVIDGEGETTAIDALNAVMSGSANIYDINGRKLDSLQKGINIVNGKKIIVRN